MSNAEYNRILNANPKMTDHRNFVAPIPHPEQPKAKHYKQGKFTRYFCISSSIVAYRV